MAYAHSLNTLGQRHDLEDHLHAVADLTKRFAKPLDAADAGYYLGLWHDIGKLHPDFQHYLLAAEKGIRRGGPRVDHKAAGALLAIEIFQPLALPIQGHHGGLTTRADFKSWLNEHIDRARQTLAMAEATIPGLRPVAKLPIPEQHTCNPLAAEMFLRLLFSALVDGDYLDTEAHFNPDQADLRGPQVELVELWRRFEADQARISGKNDDIVNRARHEIYEACLAAAEQSPGIYRLTVPTGGGKTRSAMAFALRHALRHGMERIIVAVPYLSITEQTARVYRDIFETDGQSVVLEHHSGASFDGDDEGAAGWMSLAAENWDAPIVVTTTVQLFDSLFSNRPQATRKLHRLANAVILLDEVQALPPHRIIPILDALRHLTAYNTTVVLSTATQPVYETIPGFADLHTREIVPNAAKYFAELERVRYEWRLEEPPEWADVVHEMLTEPQAMTIVNTRRDAQALYTELLRHDPHALHLSAAMCGLHKHRVLDIVRRRLADGEPCHLVSTQVVEAGVDLDFALVLRAIAPLDAIIQAAGRCNREGRLHRGRVIVFDPAEGRLPQGVYRTAAGLARAVLGSGVDPNSPAAVRPYFSRLFATINGDIDNIRDCRRRMDYVETARRFRLIDDETESVLVPYGSPDECARLHRLLDAMAARRGNPRKLWRALQPYAVALPRRQIQRALSEGMALETPGGPILWQGAYDPQMGITFEDTTAPVYLF